MWVMDVEANKMVQKDITFVPGLYKIFDEILGEYGFPMPCFFVLNLSLVYL